MTRHTVATRPEASHRAFRAPGREASAMILGVFTELMGTGGVQRVSIHSAAVLARYARRRDRPLRLLSLNDPAGEHELRVADDRVAVVGFGRSKARLVAAALSAVPRTGLMYIGHPNLAPLGIVARLVRPRVRYCVATHGVEVWERLPLNLRGVHRAMMML